MDTMDREACAGNLAANRHSIRTEEKRIRNVGTARMDFLAANLIRAQALIRETEEALLAIRD